MTLFRKGLAMMLAVSVIGCTTPNPVTIATTHKLVQHERSKSDLVSKSFNLTSGYNLVYLENLNNSAEPLLLIHGFGGNKDNFVRIAEEFKDYHVIIPDLLGFGESDKPAAEDYQADAQAQRLHELVQSMGLASNLHVGGNSMGGAITVAYGALYPEEVKSLWLIDSAGFWSVGLTDALEGSTLENNPLLIEDNEDFYNLLDLVMYKPPYIPKTVKAVFAKERIDNKELEAKILQQIVEDNVEERAKIIAQYNTPTLVVWGDKDNVLRPETAVRIAEIIPQAKVIMMPDIGHVPMLEDVKQTANDYKDFREEIKAE